MVKAPVHTASNPASGSLPAMAVRYSSSKARNRKLSLSLNYPLDQFLQNGIVFGLEENVWIEFLGLQCRFGFVDRRISTICEK